ncbi:hypothetical protein SK128_023632 [Halocaridina rubra]|uniref:Uncharacterized protein n=1 Tax=Halocaridina rubra TaxID=373956 RepID=A0AAN8X0K0_HALRR
MPTLGPKRFISKSMEEGLALIEEGLAKFEAEDFNTARYTKVARGVMECLQGYKEIWEEKKRTSFQTRPERFFKKYLLRNPMKRQYDEYIAFTRILFFSIFYSAKINAYIQIKVLYLGVMPT